MRGECWNSQRARAAAGLLISCALILLARLVHPDPRGYGTHCQLMLPPCIFHTLTHLPCPFCGLTTGFAWMARGQIREAAKAHWLAPPAYFLTIVLACFAFYGVVTGRPWLPAFVRRPAFARWLLAVLLVVWIANLGWHFVRGNV